MQRRPTSPWHWAAAIGVWACAAIPAAPAQTRSAGDLTAEAEIIRSAQLWISKHRTDLARQHIEKLLLVHPDSAWGHATLGDIALREGKAAEARAQLDLLRRQFPQHPATKELSLLSRLMGPDSQKLATMRLMAQAGRLQEAATLARSLFPDGPPTSGSMALEYYQIVSSVAPEDDTALDRALQQQYTQTGDVRYRILALQRQLRHGSTTPALLNEMARLADQPGTDEQAVRSLWSWAIDKLPWNATPAAAQAYLQRYPQDTAMQQHLAKAQATLGSSGSTGGTGIAGSTASPASPGGAARVEAKAAPPAPPSPTQLALRTADRALDRKDLPAADSAYRRALQLSPRNAEALGGLGIVAMRQSQHAEAAEFFAQALAVEPVAKWRGLRDTARFWALLARGNDALDAGDTATAAQMAEQALALQPTNPEALGLQANTLQASGQPQQAEQAWLALRQAHPDHMPAVRALVGMYLEQNRSRDAEQLLAQLPPATAAEAAGLRADLLQTQAEAALAQNQPVQAMELLETALPLAPDNAWLRHRLARTYLQQKQPALANAVMADGVALAPTDADMRQARALIWLAQDQPGAALEDMQAIAPAQRSPSQTLLLQEARRQVLIAQALAQADAGQRQALLTQAENLIGQDPDAIRQVANAWFDIGQPEQAVALWERQRTHLPATPALDLAYAQALDRARADTRLTAILPGLLDRSDWAPEDNASLLDLQSGLEERRIADLHSQGRITAARALARDVPLREGPGITPAHTAAARSRLHMAAQDSAAALPLLQQAVAADPHNFDLQVDTGNAWVLAGDRHQALPHAEAAQAMAPQQAAWRKLALVRLWQRMGRMDEAQAVLDTVARDPEADRTELLLHGARLQRAQRHYAQASQLFGQALDGMASASAAERLNVETQRQQIESRKQAWVESGLTRLHKSGTDGISTLNGWEWANVAWIPRGYEGPQFVHVDRVSLNAGRLANFDPAFFNSGDIDDLPDVARFGQLGASAVRAQDSQQGGDFLQRYAQSGWRTQSARGYNIGTGHDGDDFGWDLGLTGIGMPVTNVVGGLRWSLPTATDTSWTLRLERRPVTGSLLSYAGARDPVTGQTWGGVVLNTASARIAGETDTGWDLSAQASWGLYTGKNVASNQRVQVRTTAGTDVWRTPFQRVYAGATLTATAHTRDLSEYSWGHGGYYSPKRSLSLAFPVEWTGREGAWTWRVKASVSLSQTASSTSPLYPRPVQIPPAWQALASDLGYRSAGGSGTGWSFAATLERQVTPNLALGGHLSLDRSDYYAPTNVMLYARYYFDPVRTPLVNYPRPVTPYSQF
ncbi:cellulose synthase subunit BcsC-related outer membrane protein [Comamonas sp. 17RB]|uniref:cellulose synthase subunit BcsC-related outer membrane protein n=1 Tax=Comamonas sp. 17RB TaxID=3047025 RepID=UPI0024B75AF2|nr:cellulose synthase subunit BcsC-related outer membrane protein [Comamonas sp. 17RB]MDI9854500.1 cellulose synthase subunit BcsC-related outer membrane protein [Comamonas sp. 17RB]